MEYNLGLFNSVKKISQQYQNLQDKINSDASLSYEEVAKINKQIKKYQVVAEKFLVYESLIKNGLESEKILNSAHQHDHELVDLAKIELEEIKTKIVDLEHILKIALLPTDPNDEKNVIIEMRSAAGGDESCIFVGNLFDVYKRYIDQQKWKIKILESCSQAFGYSYISFMIKGESVYSKMKFESGVHRVQRVPATEAKGRVHTSTITVAVLPELDEIDVKVAPSDLRVDVYRASGAGGQHVNRTESAVRLTHLPTGIVASCQEGKSQIENRETAMKMLLTKLGNFYHQQQNEKLASDRKAQVGTGERSEKIRTYNYPQNRITDHRINLTLNKLDMIMASGNLQELIDPLIADEQAKLMNQLEISHD